MHARPNAVHHIMTSRCIALCDFMSGCICVPVVPWHSCRYMLACAAWRRRLLEHAKLDLMKLQHTYDNSRTAKHCHERPSHCMPLPTGNVTTAISLAALSLYGRCRLHACCALLKCRPWQWQPHASLAAWLTVLQHVHPVRVCERVA